MDNYEISRNRAQAYFLNFDQELVADTWHLQRDERNLYTHFLGRPYSICRENGIITRLWDGQQAGFGETLSIFDLLCHQGTGKYPAGTFAPVNSLRGGPSAGGVGVDFHRETAARFHRETEKFCRACRSLGGDEVDMGDRGFRFHIFYDLDVILKFYYADEDFPASVTLLWDENTLRYVYYETVFFIAGYLLGEICREMDRG